MISPPVRKQRSMAALIPSGMFASIAILFLTLTACCKGFDSSTSREDAEARTWITKSWSGQYDWAATTSWKTVTQLRESKAETLLRSVASLQLTAEQARDFVGESALPTWRGTPFLIRAVTDAPGAFRVDFSVRPDGTVWANGGANSKCPVGIKRRPLVAWLDKPPGEVYVTFFVNRD